MIEAVVQLNTRIPALDWYLGQIRGVDSVDYVGVFVLRDIRLTLNWHMLLTFKTNPYLAE